MKDEEKTIEELQSEIIALKDKLKQNESELITYKYLLNNSNDGILLTAPDGKIYYANPAACKMYGRSEEEICNIGREGLVDTSDPGLIESLKKRDINGMAVGEFYQFRKDGTRFPTEVSSVVFNTPQGSRTSMIIRDLTEQKKLNEELRSSELKFSKLFKNSLLGISHVAKDGTLLLGNDAYARIYGYETFEQMKSMVKNIKSLYFNPGERREVMKELDKNGTLGPREFCVVKHDGSKAYVLATIQKIYDDKGNYLYNDTTHFDITEKKRLEDSIHKTEERLHTVLNSTPVVIYAIDKKGTYILSEGKGLEGTGLKPGELVGTSAIKSTANLLVTLPGGKIIVFSDVLKRVFKGKSFKGFTIFKNVHFEHQFVPIFDKSGKVEFMVGVATDITESKKKEEEILEFHKNLRALSSRLNQVREEERMYLAREWHDNFGQSLTGLKLDLVWLQKRIFQDNKNYDSMQEKIGSDIDLLDSVIKDARKITTELRPNYLDTLGLIPAIEWQFEELKRRAELNVKLVKKIDKVNFEQLKATAVYRIVQESITNIIRHSKASRVNGKIYTKNKKLVIEIKDNGIGITKKQLTGINSLGILGMKERAYFIDAEISITGEKNKGTEIILSIPMETK